MNNIVKPLYAIASASSLPAACLTDVTQKYNETTIRSIGVSEAVVKYDTASNDAARKQALNTVQSGFTSVIEATNKLFDSYSKCAQQAKKSKPKLYDPIDVIAETVNFYVTSSGSVTPTWKLVSVTAPLAPTFASASRKDTNTLNTYVGPAGNNARRGHHGVSSNEQPDFGVAVKPSVGSKADALMSHMKQYLLSAIGRLAAPALRESGG